MFKNPFSFEGRIRRMEFGLTFVIYFVFVMATSALTAAAEGAGSIITLILFIPMVWFIWAQGAKRCHDLGKSGWWQLIPFYFLFLLFEDGAAARNSYGANPKNAQQIDMLESETLDGHLRS